MGTPSLLAHLALFAPLSAQAATWPEDSGTAWDPIQNLAGETLTDPQGDQGSGKAVFDIVGNDANPAGYRADDGTNYYFRVRLADSP